MPGQGLGGPGEGLGRKGGARVEKSPPQQGLFGQVRILFLHRGSSGIVRNGIYREKVNQSYIFLSFPSS
ncbi:hypothetical protein GCM10018784_52180 [Streptomyces hydrogenans]|nr:hypothetical protein GCM10018784_52180 [Streptomyces hydrogenans]